MSNQLQITGGAKVRDLNGVITGSTGVLSSLPINGANGIPQLDSSGKILVSQLPNSVMEFLGTWNAATNTPTLVNGTGNAGDVYLCTVAGTVDFGAGPITFQDGDYVVYSGSTWERSSGAMGTVTSVGASITGNSIGITGSPVTTAGTLAFAFAGTSGQYINGAGNLVTFPSLTGYVPYSGATGNVNLGEWGITSGYYGFDITPTGTPTSVGTMFWDSFYRTPSVITGTGATTLQLGQEQVTLVHNNTGATLTDGQVVYVTGSTGELPSVALATNTTEAASSVTFGVVTESIPHGADGFVTTSGMIHGLDTLAFTEGQALWLGATAGTFTNVKPVAPANSVLIGYVIKRAGGNGSIFVKIQNGYELEELHDVLISGVTNNEGLFWDSATSLWKNKTIATALGYTPISLSSLTATSPLSYNNTTGNFSIQAANISQSGYLTATDWNRFDIAYTNRITSANSPLSITSNAISISQATTSTNGYLSSTDWNTFNGKQNALTLTTTGSSGASTLVGATLNIPTYTLSGLGGVPTSRTLTINGTAYDLSADRTWTINSMVYPSAGIAVSTGTAWGTSIVDNSSNWNTAYSLRISSATAPLSISSNVISISQASSTTNGYLSSTDWNTFNNKQGQFSLTAGKVPFAVGSSSLGDTSLNYNGGNFGFGTAASTYRIDVSGSVNVTGNYYVNGVAVTTGGVTGTGTTNYLPKFTGTSTIGNSIIQDNGSRILINTGTTNQNTTINASKIAMSRTSDGAEVVYFSKNTDLGSNGTANINGYDGIQFRTQGPETVKATLDASGNLGLGVTPSAWSGSKALDMEWGGFFGSNSLGSGIVANAYYNGTNWIYRQSYASQRFQQDTDGHKWFNSTGTSTAGNPITFTQAMTLTSGGNLLVGTTTDAGYKLDVNGTGRFSGKFNVSTNISDYTATFVNSNSSSYGLYIQAGGTYNAIDVYNYTGGTQLFSLSGTGAATFSSTLQAYTTLSVTNSGAQGAILVANSTYADGYRATLRLNNTHTGGNIWELYSTNNSDGVYSGGKLGFRNTTTDIYAMTITNLGNVGIGTTSPNFKFDVQDSTTAVIRVLDTTSNNSLILQAGTGSGMKITGYNYNTSTAVPLYISVDGANTIMQRSGGNVLIGSTTDLGAYALQVTGTVSASNVFRSTNGFHNSYEGYNAWELGNAFSTSGLTLKTTSYVTVRINGSVYKLATVN